MTEIPVGFCGTIYEVAGSKEGLQVDEGVMISHFILYVFMLYRVFLYLHTVKLLFSKTFYFEIILELQKNSKIV